MSDKLQPIKDIRDRAQRDLDIFKEFSVENFLGNKNCTDEIVNSLIKTIESVDSLLNIEKNK